MSDFFEFLDFIIIVASFLGTAYLLFLRPAYQRMVQEKTWGEILGHDEGIDKD